jgi:hypothetical protein
MPKIILDQDDIYCAKIDRQSVIDELGDPIKVRYGDIADDEDCRFLSDVPKEKLLQWMNKDYNLNRWGYDEIRYEYVEAFSYSTEAEENDLAGEIHFTIYCQSGYNDAYWSRDSYVAIDDELYFIDSGGIADTDFFQWRIGYWLGRFDFLEDSELLEVSEKLSAGCSSSPSYELDKVLRPRGSGSRPAWSKKRNCFVGRLKEFKYPVEIHPSLY